MAGIESVKRKGRKMGAVCSEELSPNVEQDGSHRSQEHSGQWRKDILRNVDKIVAGKWPGKMVVFGEHAEPVYCRKDDVTNTFIAAASYGKGRIVAFNFDGMINDFIKRRDRDKTFHDNLIRWTTRQSQAMVADVKIIDIAKINNFKKVREEMGDKPVVIAWLSNTDKSDVFMDSLKDWISNGGAFVCGVTAWAWAQGGRTVKQIPTYDLLREAGILLTAAAMRPPNPDGIVKAIDNMAEKCHVEFLLDSCIASEKEFKQYGVKLAKLVGLGNPVVVEALSEHFKKFVRKYKGTVPYVPLPKTPVKGDESRVLMQIYSSMLYSGLTADKIGPGCDVFPGIIPEKNINSTSKIFKFTSKNFSDFYFTGLYLPPGEEITVKVKEGVSTKKPWTIYVGAHTDRMNIGYTSALTRWPLLNIQRQLGTEEVKITHPFGGLVFFYSPGENDNVLEVEIQNVVQAPVYDVKKDNAETVWKYTQDAPGLWAEISGHYITFIFPRAQVATLEDPTEVMKYWDDVIRHIYYLRGREVNETRRQVIVIDQQPSIGELHSGYPIVAKLKGTIKDEVLPGYIDMKKLKEDGCWGVFHEIGHNMQDSMWTFDGTKEVTCNIFSMYTTQMVTGDPAWDIVKSWPRSKLGQVFSHFKKADASFANWKKNVWAALVIYIQLARDFGWSSYAKIFRKYNELPSKDRPKTNQDKIDLWMSAFSKIVKYNLTPVFEFWGLPLSDKAREAVANLPAYFPDDMITRDYGTAQAAAILEEFPKAVRDPDPLPSVEASIEEVFRMKLEQVIKDEDEPDEDEEDDNNQEECAH